MKKALLIILVLAIASTAYSQTNFNSKLIGPTRQSTTENGVIKTKVITTPLIYNTEASGLPEHTPPILNSPQSNSNIRWSFLDAICIADFCATSGNGLYNVVGYNLNTPERVSLYNNSNSTPLWEYNTYSSFSYYNRVAISDTGGMVAASSFHNFYMFNRSSSTPVFNYNSVTDTTCAIDITSDGKFIVASNYKSYDSATVYGFSKDSTNPVWKYKIPLATGGYVYGVNISRNDSVVIVNTYSTLFVFRTYTGQLLFTAPIGGTQNNQGISGNGSIIASINFSGFLKVYQWNGSTYNFLWQYQEPPGVYYNWMYSVDITNDGSSIACGTMNFPSANSFDGKVRLFRTANGPTPIWTYSGTGDAVVSISFSKNGNILAAATYGDVNNTLPDLLVFKISAGTSNPIYTLNSPGSMFWVSTSDDGSTVMTSGKKVPARAGFGNGAWVYDVFIDTNDAPLGIISNNQIPGKFELEQNYPNPFNPVTQISYSLAADGPVKIAVFDVLGREVATLVDGNEKRGKYTIAFDGTNLTSGVYFYRLITDNYNITKKMMLIK